MTLQQFMLSNNLQPGDAVVAKKNNIGLLDHYLIYLGNYYGEYKFIANYFNGTRILTNSKISEFAQSFSPERIRRFKGNAIQREAAVQRALSRCDQNSYHLLVNNCEHFANYVQEGKAYSKQTSMFGTGMAVTGLAVAASAKTSEGRGVGTVMAILGLLTLITDGNKNQ